MKPLDFLGFFLGGGRGGLDYSHGGGGDGWAAEKMNGSLLADFMGG